MSDARRDAHVAEVAAAFWPDATPPVRPTADPAPPSVRVVPSARAPRCLLPEDPRLAARAARLLFADSGDRGRRAGHALAASLRVPGSRLVYRDRLTGGGEDTIETALHALTGSSTWAMRVSRDRANRKPVLLVLDDEGRAVAFVKVGMNDLTARLVRTEAAALATLAGRIPGVHLPRVLGTAHWRGLELLALEPLPTALARAPQERQVLAAARAVAEAEGTRREQLRATEHWQQLGALLDARADARSARLRAAWERLDRSHGEVELELGGCHGDWAPWNMAGSHDGLLVWDLERYRTGVPVGLDVVHRDLQTQVLDPDREGAPGVLERAAQLSPQLQAVGVDPDATSLVVAVYLLDIATRWIGDEQDRVASWASVLDGMVDATEQLAQDLVAARTRSGGGGA